MAVPAPTRVVDRAVSNRRLVPTLAHLAGARLGDGDDVLGELVGVTDEAWRPVFYSTYKGWWNGRRGRQPIYGVRTERWVLHFAPQGGDWGVAREDAPEGGQVRLFDTERDPGEQVDVSEQYPEVVERLELTILEKLEELALSRSNAELGPGQRTLDMLRAIGYLSDESD